jgi:tetratricopeptide (TPR) repeat protein
LSARVLLVGLDGAEPSLVSPLLDAGALPHLDRVVENGCVGTLRASAPLVRALQWTTLATGVRAPHHGVCADVEVRDDGAGVGPAGAASWRVPALWDFAAAAGLATAVVGWPATHPATARARGVLVDDAYAEALGAGFEAWPMLPDCVAPGTLRSEVRDLRVHPRDLAGPELAELVPLAHRVDQCADTRLARIAVALARTATVHAAATHLAARRDWQLLAVAYPWLADVQRECLRFHPPAAIDASAAEAEIYGPAVERAYRLQDAMLGRLLACAGDEVTVVIVSPHGFAVRNERPSGDAAERLPAAMAWHRHAGLFAASGPGVGVDVLVHDARVEDVAPTVLNLLGVRAGGLHGRCIVDVAPVDRDARLVTVPLPPRSDVAPPSAEERAALDPAAREAVERALTAHHLATAEAHLATGEYTEAATSFARLVAQRPDDWLAKARLARCHLHLAQYDACRELAAQVAAARPDEPWGHLLYASALVLAGDGAQADEHLAKARAAGRRLPNAAIRLGMLQLLREEWHEAEASFRAALAALPRSVEALDGLGCALHQQARHAEAAAAFREGLGHRYRYPLAHLHLAVTLAAQGRLREAEGAARIALEQDPAVPGADALLAAIARSRAGSRTR